MKSTILLAALLGAAVASPARAQTPVTYPLPSEADRAQLAVTMADTLYIQQHY